MNEIILELATEDDLPRIAALWKQCFGDEEELVCRLLTESDVVKNTVTAKIGGKIVSFMCAFDDTPAKGLSYLYALCTDPGYRKCGIGGMVLEKTMELAFQRGMNTVFLHPADNSLSAWYEKQFSMLPCGYYGMVPFSAKPESGTQCNISEISLEEYLARSDSRLPSAFICAQKILSDAYGGRYFIVGEKAAYAELRDKRLTIKEHRRLTASEISALSAVIGTEQVVTRKVSHIKTDETPYAYLLTKSLGETGGHFHELTNFIFLLD